MKHRIRFTVFIIALMMACICIPQFSYGADEITTDSEPDVEAQTDAEVADDEALLMQYLDKSVGENSENAVIETPAVRGAKSNRRSRLGSRDKQIYDALREKISEIAAGTVSSTALSVPLSDIWADIIEPSDASGFQYMITSERLGIDAIYEKLEGSDRWTMTSAAQSALYNVPSVMNALISDLPYELFWFDKTTGYRYSTNARIVTKGENAGKNMYFTDDPALSITMYVSDDYSADSNTVTDTDKIGRAVTAAEVIGNIIDQNAGLSDLDKLTAYRDEICRLTKYDHSADADDARYGDPWQLINVFDEDTSTNVVCEGYCKAFQYLCDLTDFNDDTVECFTVTGKITTRSGQENHMWNILRMNDGSNYLADITNCDGDAVGAPDKLFLKGYTSGDVYDGYRFKIGSQQVSYRYDDTTVGLYDTAELELSEWEYFDCDHEWGEWTVTTPATCTSVGIESMTCSKDPKHVRSRETGEIDPDNHANVKTLSYIAPQVDQVGRNKYYRCTGCGRCFKDAKCTKPTTPEAEVIPELIDIKKCEVSGVSDKTYSGNYFKPSITVKKGSTRLVKGTDFTVSYSNNRNVGRASVTIKGKGLYGGSKTVHFKIKPKGTSLVSVTGGKRSVSAKWKKQSAKMSEKRIRGYHIQCSISKDFSSGVKNAYFKGHTVTSRWMQKYIKSNKKYYVRVRTYMRSNGKTYYSNWSKVKTVRTK